MDKTKGPSLNNDRVLTINHFSKHNITPVLLALLLLVATPVASAKRGMQLDFLKAIHQAITEQRISCMLCAKMPEKK